MYHSFEETETDGYKL